MFTVQRCAGILAYATLVLMSVLILAALVFLVMPDLLRSLLVEVEPHRFGVHSLSLPILYGLQVAGWLVLTLYLFVMWQIYSLFCLYAQSEALSDRCGRHLHRIGIGLMLMPVATMVYGMVSSVLLSWNNGPGAREVTVAIDLQGLGFVVGGALLLFVGMTIRDATRLAEENRGFV